MAKNKDTLTLDLFAPEAKPLNPAAESTSVEKTVHQAAEIARRDEICQEWPACIWAEACLSLANDQDGYAYCENWRNHPLTTLSRDEAKIVSAGLFLVKYLREDKIVRVTEADPANGWLNLGPFATYAQAERKLKELKEHGHIESGTDGKIVMTGWLLGTLRDKGFDFYRQYGTSDYHTGFCIKQGSKNWSNWQKYETDEALQAAWIRLMQDLKALEG